MTVEDDELQSKPTLRKHSGDLLRPGAFLDQPQLVIDAGDAGGGDHADHRRDQRVDPDIGPGHAHAHRDAHRGLHRELRDAGADIVHQHRAEDRPAIALGELRAAPERFEDAGVSMTRTGTTTDHITNRMKPGTISSRKPSPMAMPSSRPMASRGRNTRAPAASKSPRVTGCWFRKLTVPWVIAPCRMNANRTPTNSAAKVAMRNGTGTLTAFTIPVVVATEKKALGKVAITPSTRNGRKLWRTTSKVRLATRPVSKRPFCTTCLIPWPPSQTPQ